MKININTIKETKFSKKLKNTKKINRKEVAYLSMPGNLGKFINISKNRKKKSVELNIDKIKKELNDYFIKLYNNKKNIIENKASILHTHIYKKNRKYTALPSLDDINNLIITNKIISHKYEIIAVFDANKKELGYTTLKINNKKLNDFLNENKDKNLKEIINEKVNHIKNKKKEKIEDKIILFNILEKIGIDIYFSPLEKYKLDSNFNYTKKG